MKRGLRRDKGNFSTACETSEKRELSRGKICNLQWLRLPHRQVRLPAHTVRVSVCVWVTNFFYQQSARCNSFGRTDGLHWLGWPYCSAALKKMLLERDPLFELFPFSALALV